MRNNLSRLRWSRILRMVLFCVTTGLLGWSCVVKPGISSPHATPLFMTFDKGGDRTVCCGVALPADGSTVVVGRVDTIAGKSWAWAAKVLRSGAVAWERDWSALPESSGFSAVTEIADDAVI